MSQPIIDRSCHDGPEMILTAFVFAGFTVAYVRLGSLLALLLLSGCGDAASCWNRIKARATTCEQMRLDEAERNNQERSR